jgi:hypothetical protein
MSFDPLSAAFDLGKVAIEKIFPDPTKRAMEMRLLEELRQKGGLAELNAHVQLMLAQIKVNEVSAAHPSLFVAGSRPFIIWVGGLSLAWAGLIHPLLMWVWAFAEMTGTPPPMIESAALGTILSGLLGVAGMRSFDKSKGTDTRGTK